MTASRILAGGALTAAVLGVGAVAGAVRVAHISGAHSCFDDTGPAVEAIFAIVVGCVGIALLLLAALLSYFMGAQRRA